MQIYPHVREKYKRMSLLWQEEAFMRDLSGVWRSKDSQNVKNDGGVYFINQDKETGDFTVHGIGLSSKDMFENIGRGCKASTYDENNEEYIVTWFDSFVSPNQTNRGPHVYELEIIKDSEISVKKVLDSKNSFAFGNWERILTISDLQNGVLKLQVK